MFFQTLFLFLRTVFFPRILIFPRNLYLLRSSSVSLTSSTDMFSSGKYGSIPKKRVMVSFLVQLLYIILRIADSLNRVAIRIVDTRRNYKIKNQIILLKALIKDRNMKKTEKRTKQTYIFKICLEEKDCSRLFFFFFRLFMRYIILIYIYIYIYIYKYIFSVEILKYKTQTHESTCFFKYSCERLSFSSSITFIYCWKLILLLYS